MGTAGPVGFGRVGQLVKKGLRFGFCRELGLNQGFLFPGSERGVPARGTTRVPPSGWMCGQAAGAFSDRRRRSDNSTVRLVTER